MKVVTVSGYSGILFIVPDDYAMRHIHAPMDDICHYVTESGTMVPVKGHVFSILRYARELSLSDVVLLRLEGKLSKAAFDHVTEYLHET